jgi:hypothetical protein
LWIWVRCCIYNYCSFSFICVNNLLSVGLAIKLLFTKPSIWTKAAVGISTRIEPVTVELAIYVLVGFDCTLVSKLALSRNYSLQYGMFDLNVDTALVLL